MGEGSKRNLKLVSTGIISTALGDIPLGVDGGLRAVFLVLRDRIRLAVEKLELEMLVSWRSFLAGVSIIRENNVPVDIRHVINRYEVVRTHYVPPCNLKLTLLLYSINYEAYVCKIMPRYLVLLVCCLPPVDACGNP